MANVLYDKGREGFLAGNIDWDTDAIKCFLIDKADHTPDTATHEFMTSIEASARVAQSGTFSSKTVTDGVADAADEVFTSATGDVSEAIIIYASTGTEGTSRLIAYISAATGLPVTPNGGNINVTWDSGVNKIFKL